MRYVAALMLIVLVVSVATLEARPITEEQKKAKRPALSKDPVVPPRKKNERLQRRMERNLEEDFSTGIGDKHGKAGKGGKGGGDDDDDD